MHLTRNADLRGHNTFAVAARAYALAQIDHWYQLEPLLALDDVAERPLLILGGGSNILFRGDFPGVVLKINNRGIRPIQEDRERVFVRVAAGVEWHELVLWAAGRGLWGIENLAFIPGRVGAAPIQNLGAYGTDLSETLRWVKAFDRDQRAWRTLTRDECALDYRSSRFKDLEPDRFVITEVLLELKVDGAPRTDYPGVKEALAELKTGTPSPARIAAAITRIRQRKLPDPERLPNAGSFFKNPIVSPAVAERLRDRHESLPAWPAGEGLKLSAAWLIERCGWKGHREGDAGVAPQHALVLVNYGGASGVQIWDLARRIQDSVFERFGIRLEPEPQIY